MAAWGVGNSFKNWLLKSCLSNKNFRCFWWVEITKTTTCCRKLPADRLIMNNMRFQRHSLTKIFQRNQIRATVWTFRLLWLQKADQPVVQVWSRCFRGKPEHTIPCWSLSFSPPHLKCYFTLDLFLDSCHQYIQSDKCVSACTCACVEWTAANIGTNCGQKWTVAGNTVRFPASLAGDESGSPSDASASSAASICSLTLCTFASWYSMHLCCSKTKVLKKTPQQVQIQVQAGTRTKGNVFVFFSTEQAFGEDDY